MGGQEVIRMLLDAIYEPRFKVEETHGRQHIGRCGHSHASAVHKAAGSLGGRNDPAHPSWTRQTIVTDRSLQIDSFAHMDR
jgi:hypothetical protein